MKKKLTMTTKKGMTLEEGCNLHLENCRQRNLREGTLRHYKDCYVQFKKYFSPNMLLSEMTEKKCNEYILDMSRRLGSDETVRTYSRALRTVLYFLMEEGYVQQFKRPFLSIPLSLIFSAEGGLGGTWPKTVIISNKR